MSRSVSLTLLLLGGLASSALAGPNDISPDLRQRAQAVCRQDVLRLCPEAVMDETSVVACMIPKRALVSAPCRRIFDEISRVVQR